ncbi:hypothetical protein [Aquimarina pacifica]|uniref:hypothetical protein n=1 Tax=Aquimarina pacifica TaxID=1296415 RepID=UPI00046F95A0|nr:hypothetical protein [Aquimarina pacifica]
MSQIVKILNEIKSKPAMYIGRSSIFCLRAYLFGCYRSLPKEDIEFLNDFQSWIENKYKIDTSHSWADILHFYSTDEQDALKLFFNEFDEFLNQLSEE